MILLSDVNNFSLDHSDNFIIHMVSMSSISKVSNKLLLYAHTQPPGKYIPILGSSASYKS